MRLIGRPPGIHPCIDQPCPNTGRGSSGFCRTHYKALWNRTRRFKRVCRTELTFAGALQGLDSWVSCTPLGAETRAAVQRMFEGLARGDLLITRNGAMTQRRAGLNPIERFRGVKPWSRVRGGV